MEKINIKPGYSGLVIRCPVSKKPLKEAGEMKPNNRFWQRRLAEGSVVKVGSSPKPKPKVQPKEEISNGGDK